MIIIKIGKLFTGSSQRPETLDFWSNILAGTNKELILKCSKEMKDKKRNWKNPFGDGKAGEKIIKVLVDRNRL
jgi:UDP-N-acetylglucosamine 2-epimerase (non-hydrolysing)